jgi:hypothetical protein
MTDDERQLALQNAVLEWQKKYGVRDGDPVLAMVELLHVYLKSFAPSLQRSDSPTFGEFRGSIELLDQRTKTFSKQATELIQELRMVSRKMGSPTLPGKLFIYLIIFAVGVLTGSLLWR